MVAVVAVMDMVVSDVIQVTKDKYECYITIMH